ncbi:hypothetical protein [Alteromonas genovensis]|uniref:hypothetical protein n=1 Tax=Alteromonas genovensis TaxID=471225 RepID=UPI002FE11DFF
MKSKKHPDVLKVVEFILDKAANNEKFSVQSAADSKALNGFGRYQIARIMPDICLDPEDEGSLNRYTTVDDTNMDNIPCHWQLNAEAYFSYLSYKSTQVANRSMYVAICAAGIALVALLLDIFGTCC